MSKIEILVWCNAALAVFGTYLNAKQIRVGFLIWLVTNTFFVINNIYLKSYPQAALFTVYVGLAILGWINWGKNNKKQKSEENA